MDIIPAISSKSQTKDTTFANYLLIVDTYYKLPKLYGMDKITIEKVLENLYMFQSRFGKVEKLAGGIWRESKRTLDHTLPPRIPGGYLCTCSMTYISGTGP